MIYINYTNKIEKELCLILGKVSHHIHPQIVKYITEKNIEFKVEFENFCNKKLDTSSFFYEKSDCIFPGLRRAINSEKDEIIQWKRKVNFQDGTILDDNEYPRHLWTYLTIQKCYSGPNWKESELNQFELAHIFNHKSSEMELEKKVFKNFNSKIKPYAHFTSSSNVVLIPNGIVKPTDKMDIIKICFYKRHIDLYGENFACMSSFDESKLPEWYNEIEWLEPILPNNWKESIDKLLKYRDKNLRNKYK